MKEDSLWTLSPIEFTPAESKIEAELKSRDLVYGQAISPYFDLHKAGTSQESKKEAKIWIVGEKL